jgi:lipopolysaccharide biosynthesis glycosyltransferase
MSESDPKDTIQVVLCCDANYVMPLTVAICSAAKNCDSSRSLVFNVFQHGINSELRRRVEISLKRTGSAHAYINWLEAPLGRLPKMKIVNKWLTAMAWLRLLIPDLLPLEVKKALYFDCDVVVEDDLSGLWDLDIGEKSLLAVRDTIGCVSNPDGGLCNYRELGIPGDAKYFNSGVLLLNLERWRARETSGHLVSYMMRYRDIIRYEDQEVLNAVLFDDWGELEFRWNWQIVWRGVRIGTHKEGWVPDRERKSIVHFITSEKPWVPGCECAEKELFFKYLDRTEWAGWRVPWYKEIYRRGSLPLEDARNALGRFRRKLFRTAEHVAAR